MSDNVNPTSDIPNATNVTEMNTGGFEQNFMVGNDTVVKVPKDVLAQTTDSAMEHVLVGKYIELNTALGKAVDENRGKEGMEFLGQVRVIEMQPVEFSPSLGTITPVDTKAEPKELPPGNHFGVEMPNLAPDSNYTVIDIADLDNEEFAKQGESNSLIKAAVDAKLDIKEIQRKLHYFAQDNGVDPVFDGTFHVRVARTDSDKFDWEIIPLDYTNAHKVDPGYREEQMKRAIEEGNARNANLRSRTGTGIRTPGVFKDADGNEYDPFKPID